MEFGGGDGGSINDSVIAAYQERLATLGNPAVLGDLFAAQSLLGILEQEMADEISGVWFDLLWISERASTDLGKRLSFGLGQEWRLTGQQLVAEDS